MKVKTIINLSGTMALVVLSFSLLGAVSPKYAQVYGYVEIGGTRVTQASTCIASEPSIGGPHDAGFSLNLTASFANRKGQCVVNWYELFGTPTAAYDISTWGDPVDGWAGKSSMVYEDSDAVTQTVSFMIMYGYIDYNLKYDSAGGNTVSSQVKLAYTDSVTLALAPSRTGYEFAGWKDAKGNVFTAGQSVKGESFVELNDVHESGHDVTLTAQWNEKSYAVGSSGENCTVTVAPSAKFTDALQISWQPEQANFTHPTVVVHAGSDETGAVLATFKSGTSATFTMSASDAYYDRIFVTASYEVYTLTFNPNGGTCGEQSRRIERGATLAPPNLPTPIQYKKEFEGWFLDNGAQIGSTTTYDWEIDVTVKAKWRDAELMTIETEVIPGGAGTVSGAGDYLPGETAHLNVTETADGYSFSHWTNAFSQAGWATPTLEVKVDGNAKYTAVFTGNVYQVTFYASEGEPDEQVQGFTFGKPYGSLPSVTREGDWTFDGWFTKPKGKGERITEDTVFTETDNELWLYANWKAIPTYTIRYNGNGAPSGTMSDQKAYCGVDTTLTLNQFAWGGYHFRGWTNAVGTTFADGEIVRDLALTNEIANLYAKWEQFSLAEAMHCDNLEWDDPLVDGDLTGEEWTIDYGEGKGSNSWSCVRQEGSAAGTPRALTSEQLIESGTLSFYWKQNGESGKLSIWTDDNFETSYPSVSERTDLSGQNGEWVPVNYPIEVPEGKAVYVHLMNLDSTFPCDIDRMTWTPEGKNPMPGEPVRVSATAVENGVFKLSVAAASGFDYGVWTNADLTVDRWGLMGEPQAGEDETLDFSWTILPEMPQLFFRAHKVDYK